MVKGNLSSSHISLALPSTNQCPPSQYCPKSCLAKSPEKRHIISYSCSCPKASSYPTSLPGMRPMEPLPVYEPTKTEDVSKDSKDTDLAAACIHRRSHREKTRPFNLRTELKGMHKMVELLVGTQQMRFLVHKELLTYNSDFFRAALNGAWAEGLSQSVQLPDENLDTFELFLYWLYTGGLDAKAYFKDQKPAYYVLLHLYALADRLGFERLRNLIIDTVAYLADHTNSVLTPSDTFILYEQIRDSAPLRKLILDLFAFKKTDKLLDEHPDPWNELFMRQLVVKLKRPDDVAIQRHTLKQWNAVQWPNTKGCSICSESLQAGAPFQWCADCGKKFCARCSKISKGMAAFEEGRDMCKPWSNKARCKLYHEHEETTECPSVV